MIYFLIYLCLCLFTGLFSLEEYEPVFQTSKLYISCFLKISLCPASQSFYAKNKRTLLWDDCRVIHTFSFKGEGKLVTNTIQTYPESLPLPYFCL